MTQMMRKLSSRISLTLRKAILSRFQAVVYVHSFKYLFSLSLFLIGFIYFFELLFKKAEDESSAEDDFDLEEALRAERQEGGKKVTASKKRQAPEPSSSAASHGKGKKLAEKARRKAHVPEGESSEEEDMFDTTKLVPYNQGVVYVGRIPHGFYEDQMRGFFSQFGRVVNLRVSRSKKSGKSKHYAFVQFETPVVADIVAQAMDNYLMFHRIVKCKLMAPEDVHPQIWKGDRKSVV